jgi:hypothetical protein
MLEKSKNPVYHGVFFWRVVQGSNLRPMVLETIALPTELTTHTALEASPRIAWASLSQAFKADKRKKIKTRALLLEL